MKLWGLLAALLAAIATPAEARMHAPYEAHRIVPSGAGALDGFTAPAGAYSFRKLKSSYAGPLAKIRRTTGGTQDINATPNGDFDTAAATIFCAATTCWIDTLYDQSGNTRNLTNAVTTEQPQLIFNCIGAKVCMRGTQAAGGGSGNLTYGTGIGAAVTYSSFSRLENTTQTITLYTGGEYLFFSATQIGLFNSSVSLAVAATPGAWHAVAGTIAGASSNLTVDGTTTAGTLTFLGGAGPMITGTGSIGAAASTTEVVAWDAYTMLPAQQVAWTNNQKDYWAPYSLDAFATPAGAYSFRKLKSTYSGPAIRIRRASDNGETDINYLGFVPGLGSPLDYVAASTHCAATTCQITAWYDQSGNTRDLLQPTAVNQPWLVFNCLNGLPCYEGRAAPSVSYIQTAVGFGVASGVSTQSRLFRRTSGGGGGVCMFMRNGNTSGNRIYGNNGPVGPGLAAASGGIGIAAPEDVWHATYGVTNGASSALAVDGATTTGTVTGDMSAGAIGFLGDYVTACRDVEAILWDNYVMPAAEITRLYNNQRSFWGLP